MKKIGFIFLLVGVMSAAKAQVNYFPTIDSLENYINTYIRNSAINAFTNLRLNTALNGITQFLDSVRTRGVDSVDIVPNGDASVDTFWFYRNRVKAFYKLSSAGGGGSGTDNTNAGSSFRWLNPGTQALRTVANGYGVVWDSSSTSNALTAKLDTANAYPNFKDGIRVNTAVTYSSTTKRADAQSIIKLPSSRRLLMFYTQYGSSSGDNDSAEIRLKISDDNGDSWGSAQVVVPHSGTGVYIPSAYFNNAGDTLYVIYYRQNSSTTGQIYQTYSVNFTASTPTWASGASIYGSGSEYYSPAADRVFRLKNGDLLYPFCVNTNGTLTSATGNYRGRMLRRAGGTGTWALEAGVDIGSPDSLCVEPGLYQLDDPLNLVIFYYRTRSGQVYFNNSTSSSGLVYGSAQPIGLYAPNSTTTIVYLEKFKTLLAAHNVYVGSGAVNGITGRRQMGFSVKHIGGGNGDHQQVGYDGAWSLIYRVDSVTNRQYIEPSITPVENEIIVAYADGDYAVGDTFNIKVTKLPYHFIPGQDLRYTSNLIMNKTFNGTADTWLEMYVNGLSQTANYIKLKNQTSGSTFLLPWWQIKTARNQGDVLLTDIDMPTTTNSSAAIAYDLKTSGGEYALSLANPYFRLKNNGTTLFTVMSNGMTEIIRKNDAGASTFMRLGQSGISSSTGYLEFWNYGTSGGSSVAYGMKVRSSSGNFGMNYEYVGTMNSEGVLHNFKTAANGAITSTNKLYQIQNNGTDAFAIYASGNSITPASTYRNWGTTNGSSGYGLFDNAGTLQMKNSGGAWSNIMDVGSAQTVSGVKTFTGNEVFQGTGVSATFNSGTTGIHATGSSYGGELYSSSIPVLSSNSSTSAGVVNGAYFQRTGSYTGANNDGLQLRFAAKNSSNASKDFFLFEPVLQNATASSERGGLLLKFMTGGSAAATKFTFNGDGSSSQVGVAKYTSDLIGSYDDRTLTDWGNVKKAVHDSLATLDSSFVATFSVSDATPTTVATIGIGSASEVVTVVAILQAQKNDGTTAVMGTKSRSFFLNASASLTAGTLITDRAVEYIGSLSTATFTITTSGGNIIIQFTGEGSTAIEGQIKYEVHRHRLPT